MNGLAERNGGQVGLLALAAILVLGLGLRVNEAWQGRAPVLDATAYAKIAASLDRGNGFTLGPSATQPASNYSPGLPLLAAGIYELTGGVHERAARLILALLGTLAVLFTYLIGRRLSGPGAGLAGAAAIAIYPALLEYQGMLMGESLAASLLAGAVLTTLWASGIDRSRPSRGWPGAGGSRTARGLPAGPPAPGQDPRARWLVPGLLFGLLALVRPEYLGVALLVSLVVLAKDWRVDWRPALTRTVFLLLGVAVVVVPWTVRNAVALDRFVPISTGGGQVLFAGTYLPSDGDPEKVGAEVVAHHPELFGPGAVQNLRLEQILARLAANRYPGLESDKALSRMGREQLSDDISEEPLEYAGFVATKVGRIWSHGPRAVMREPGWALLHWLLIVFGLLGLAVLALQRRWEALLLATIFVAISAISALLVASPRRVLVMMPLVAALAGSGITWLWAQGAGWLKRRRPHTSL
ncbi:MAG TPA: glycosyltransferase family 39 protein [Solirubrobacterales bacterium]